FPAIATDHTLDVTFQNAFPVAVTAGANGSVSPAGTTFVACGADQAVTITPDACYAVADVLVDGVSIGAATSYTFTNVNAAHTLAATFASNAQATGTTSPDYVATVNPVTPVVTLSTDTNPSSWSGDVVLTATVNPATATGSITFKDSTTVIGTVALSSGTASIHKSNFTAAGHTLT